MEIIPTIILEISIVMNHGIAIFENVSIVLQKCWNLMQNEAFGLHILQQKAFGLQILQSKIF